MLPKKILPIAMAFLFATMLCACTILPPPAPKPFDTPLEQVYLAPPPLAAIIPSFEGEIGLFAKNLSTGAIISFNHDKIFPTASTNKLLASVAVYKYLYDNASLFERECYNTNIEQALTHSDNASYTYLLNEIQKKRPGALNQTILDLGLKKSTINNQTFYNTSGFASVTTPYEMATVMEAIYNEQYLGAEKSKRLKKHLANTIFHDEIPRHMQTTVMHKTGQLRNLLCDVGIVDDGKNRILLSIYTLTDKSDQYASDFIASLAKKTYTALKN